MQTLLPLDVARSAVASQFTVSADETTRAPSGAPRLRVRSTRTRLARALHHLGDTVAPRPTGACRTAH